MIIILPIFIVVSVIAWMLRPRKIMTEARKVAIMTVIIPSFIVAMAAIIFQLVYNSGGNEGVADIPNTLFITSLGIIGAAILTLIGFALMRKGETAKGIGFGICIAVITSIIELGILEGLAGV